MFPNYLFYFLHYCQIETTVSHFDAEFKLHLLFILNTALFIISSMYCELIMEKNIEQRVYFNFAAYGSQCSFVFGVTENVTEGLRRISLSKTRPYKQYKALKNGRDMMEELLRSRNPIIIHPSIRSSTSATEVNIAQVKDLGMKHVAARLVPKT